MNLVSADPPCCPGLFDAPLSEHEAAELAALLKALADPVRLRLISLIAASEGDAEHGPGWACACDLPAALDRSQPTVSHHLSQLVKAGILEREQRGKWAWFRVRMPQVAALQTALTAAA